VKVKATRLRFEGSNGSLDETMRLLRLFTAIQQQLGLKVRRSGWTEVSVAALFVICSKWRGR